MVVVVYPNYGMYSPEESPHNYPLKF